MNKRLQGGEYEEIAMNYLLEKGYRILTHNYYTKYGELDIIAKDNNTYSFVEVKYRKSDRCGKPYEAVTHQKKQRIMKSAIAYAKEKHIFGQPMRFDIIDILDGDITHYENAFEMDRRYNNF